MRVVSLVLMSGMAVGVSAADAWAGAWPQAKGDGLVIGSVTAKDYGGKSYRDISLYAEAGLPGGVALRADVRSWAGQNDSNTFLSLGLSRAIWRDPDSHSIASLSLGVVSGRDWFACGGTGLEGQLSVGRSLDNGSFIDVGLGYRGFEQGCGEWRAEASWGALPPTGYGFLVQVFGEQLSDTPTSFFAATRRVQFQVGLGRVVAPSTSLMLSVKVGADDLNDTERGLTLGLWRRF